MGLISAMVGKVTATAVDTFLLVTSEIFPNFTKESRAVYPPGYEGIPLEEDQGIVIKVGSKGKTAFIGSFPPDSEMEAGEARFYARDSDGNITAEVIAIDGAIIIDVAGTQIWVTDGEIALGEENPGDNLALASLVMDRLDTLQSTFDGHDHITTATVGATPTPGVISPYASPIGPLDDVKSDLITAK